MMMRVVCSCAYGSVHAISQLNNLPWRECTSSRSPEVWLITFLKESLVANDRCLFGIDPKLAMVVCIIIEDCILQFITDLIQNYAKFEDIGVSSLNGTSVYNLSDGLSLQFFKSGSKNLVKKMSVRNRRMSQVIKWKVQKLLKPMEDKFVVLSGRACLICDSYELFS